MFIAAASVPRSFQRTLMPRSAVDQGVVTGVMVSGNYATAAFLQDVIEALAERVAGRAYREDRTAWRRLTALADLAAIGAGILVQAAVPQQPNEGLPRGALRTSGWYLSNAGLAGLAAAASQEAGSALNRRLHFAPPLGIPAGAALSAIMEYRRRRRLHDDAPLDGGQTPQVSMAKALGVGGAVAAGLLGMAFVQRGAAAATGAALARLLPGSEQQWRPVGRLTALGALGFGVGAVVQNAYHRAESGAEKPEPGFEEAPTSPLVSGGPGSVVPYDTLTKEARRHVLTYLRPEWIEESMGEPPRAAPIRVYVGMDTAPTDDERVALALAEIDRTGALDRRLVVLVSPTGTGYVNHKAMLEIELLTLGDCSTITMQ